MSMIHPENLAAKMDAVQRRSAPLVAQQLKTFPRLFELLWTIQGVFMLPGGAETFIAEFLDFYHDRLGVPAMWPAPKGNAPYPKKQRDQIISEIPSWEWESFCLDHGIEDNDLFALDDPRPEPKDERARLQFLSNLNFATFHALFRNRATDDLPSYLDRVCNEPQTPLAGQSYLPDLPQALLEFIDHRAAQTCQRLAMTEVTLKIFDALEYAWQERTLAHVTGESRFGKSESIKTWAAAWPGKARLVTVPYSNCDADLIQAFAESLGLEFTLQTSRRELKASVEYILRHCGLMFILDESHFLFPARFSRNTPPMRLNWLRTQLVDRKCPVVLVSTPQEFDRCKAKFVKATSHRIEQFMGRIMHTVTLPNELEPDDLMAVAKIHFPELDEDFLQVIVGTAMRSESYLMTVEAIARRVRYIARRDGHTSVTLADLKLAISEVMPSPAAPPPARRAQENSLTPAPLAIAAPRPRRNRPASAPAQRSTALSAPSRSIMPATETQPA